MISSEHDALISHLNNGTNCCYAPSERYCSVGRQLWIEDKAADFMRLRDDNARRYAMEQLRRNVAPEWVALIRRGWSCCVAPAKPQMTRYRGRQYIRVRSVVFAPAMPRAEAFGGISNEGEGGDMGNIRLSTRQASKLGLTGTDPFEDASNPFVPRRRRKTAEPVAVMRLPRQLINETPVANGTLYQTRQNAWLLVARDGGCVIRLPYPVTANMIWRHHNDNTMQSEAARAYKRNVRELYAGLLATLGWQPYSGMLECRLMIQPPAKERNFTALTHPRYDVDNYSKPILDSIKGKGMFCRDDRLFLREQVRFAAPIADGCAWLSCMPIDESGWLHRAVDLDWLIGAAG